jgi:hypothetical protein
MLWGLLLSPSNAELAGPMIPHSLVLLLVGQAYIIAMLAAFIHSKAFIRPKSYNILGHWNGYKEGLRRAVWIYEAVEGIYLAPLFR